MGTFFAAAVMRGHTPNPKEFFGTAFWIGFTLQMIAAEIWINHTRPTAAHLAVLSGEVSSASVSRSRSHSSCLAESPFRSDVVISTGESSLR
jgi:hypothetical protein